MTSRKIRPHITVAGNKGPQLAVVPYPHLSVLDAIATRWDANPASIIADYSNWMWSMYSFFDETQVLLQAETAKQLTMFAGLTHLS